MDRMTGADPYAAIQRAAMASLQRAAALEQQDRRYSLDLLKFKTGQENAAERLQILEAKRVNAVEKAQVDAQFKEYTAQLKGQTGQLNAIKVYQDALEKQKKEVADSFKAEAQARAEIFRIESGRMGVNRAAQAAGHKPLSLDVVDSLRAEMNPWIATVHKGSPRAVDERGITDYIDHSKVVPSLRGGKDPQAYMYVREYLGADPTNREKVYQRYKRAAESAPPPLTEAESQQIAALNARVDQYAVTVSGYQDFLNTDPGKIVERMASGAPSGTTRAAQGAPPGAQGAAQGAPPGAQGAAQGPGLPYGVIRTPNGDLPVSFSNPGVVAGYLEIGGKRYLVPTHGARENAPQDYERLDFVNRSVWEGHKFVPTERLLNRVAKQGMAKRGATPDGPMSHVDGSATGDAITAGSGAMLPTPPSAPPSGPRVDTGTLLGPPPVPVPSPQGALPPPTLWDRIVEAPARAIDAIARGARPMPPGLFASAAPGAPSQAPSPDVESVFTGRAPVSTLGGGAPFVRLGEPGAAANFRGMDADMSRLARVPLLPDLVMNANAQAAVDDVIRDPAKLRALIGNLRASTASIDPEQRAQDVGNALMHFAYTHSGGSDAWPAYAHAYKTRLQREGLLYDYNGGRGRPPSTRSAYGDPLPIYAIDENP